MMRLHCDRCDALCDECQTWVEDKRETVHPQAGICHHGEPASICPLCESKQRTIVPHACNLPSHIWHIVIHAGGQVPCEEKMFCRACRIAILEAYVKGLKEKS